MASPPRICVVVPVYNHGETVRRVVRESQRVFPLIVVDDGSTDGGPELLAQEGGITLVTLPCNRGKAAALKAGFAKGEELGFTHAITVDADGQHDPTDLLKILAAARRHPPLSDFCRKPPHNRFGVLPALGTSRSNA